MDVQALVARELRRTAEVLTLRKALERHVVAATQRPPANEAFNAWVFCNLARSHAAGLPEGEHLFVPLAAPSSWPLSKYFQVCENLHWT